ncbi:MAG: adenylate/guanylate cyclase domain-containing protein [Balneolales bacterium]
MAIDIRSKWRNACITGLLAFLFALIISNTSPLLTVELKSLDLLFEMRGPLDVTDSPIVLIAISQQADQEIHDRWPWPYRHHARLIDNLNKAGAKVIGLDVIFDQPDRFEPENDTIFARSLSKHKNVILAGNILVSQSQSSKTTQLVEPFNLLNQYNPNPWGLVSVVNDPDGVLRKYALQRSHFGKSYNAFALELLRIYLDLEELSLVDHGKFYEAGPYYIPKDGNNNMMINYHGAPKTFTEFSYDQIIDDRTFVTVSDEIYFPDDKEQDTPSYGLFDDPDFGLLHTGDLEGKIVLVGSTMAELHDYFSTPFAPGNNMPGFEIHAHALQTILDENHIQKVGHSSVNLLILCFAFMIAIITVYMSAIPGLLSVTLVSLFYCILYVYSFIEYSYNLEITGPLLAIFFSYIGGQTSNYISEQKTKKRIQGMFGSYVSPVLVKKMIESGEEPNLGGEEVNITALFSDIEGFSAFSEKLSPTQLVELINEYLTGMTNILSDEGATLDKYIGDAIVAFFGAPVPAEDHAYRACIASQRMLLMERELRAKWKGEGDKWPELVRNMHTRIGLNTGLMVTGNMGSTRRFNYTIMGDNVNLAARCESGAKSYGIQTMVSEVTKLEAEKKGNDCVFRHLDKIVVLGRRQPVNIYEIIGLHSHLDPATYECVELYEKGLEEYFRKDWNDAIKSFRSSAKLEPCLSVKNGNINPSQLMLSRCEQFKNTPPEPSWDGAYVMKNK